jgi:hypothetical protein
MQVAGMKLNEKTFSSALPMSDISFGEQNHQFVAFNAQLRPTDILQAVRC